MSDDFTAFLDGTDAGTQRRASDVIAADEAEPLDDDKFDDALWLALCGLVERRGEFLSGLPDGVSAYYATRLIEWEAGNGGFFGAVANCEEYLDAAEEGYVYFGDERSADLMRRVKAQQDDDDALEAFDAEVEGPPWNGVPWGDEARVSYVRSHRDEFRL